ncbi:MAG: sigma-70 family RNA polymerase sigma factor [Alphaproteobacteria bacterium]
MFTQNALMAETEKLQRFSLKLTRNKSNANDLFQSTYLRALEKSHQFQHGTNLFHWTSKIMYNLFVSDYRRKVKFESQYDPESYLNKMSIAAPQERNSELANVKRAMMKLNNEHRQVLILVGVKGMRYDEVSEMLKIPVGTVRSRLSRAREQLQIIMDTPTPRITVQAVAPARPFNENMPRIPAFIAARAMQRA